MEISPSPAATATDPQPATLFVALELSKAKWLVGLHSPMADKVSRHTIAGGDAPALLTLIGAARRRAEAGLGGTVRGVTCYEGGYDGFWLHRLLVAHGIANQVIDPASLLVNRRARRRKTDRIDLARLLRTLMVWHRAQPRPHPPRRPAAHAVGLVPRRAAGLQHGSGPQPRGGGSAASRSRAGAAGPGARPAPGAGQGTAVAPGRARLPARPARLAGSARGPADGRRPAVAGLPQGGDRARVPAAGAGGRDAGRARA